LPHLPFREPCADRFRIDSADRPIQVDAAENFDARHFLPNDVGQRGGRFVMILQHEATHAAFFRKSREVDGIDRARPAVGIAVRVNVNHTRQGRLAMRRRGHDAQTKQKA
jgi:hypothetical protein